MMYVISFFPNKMLEVINLNVNLVRRTLAYVLTKTFCVSCPIHISWVWIRYKYSEILVPRVSLTFVVYILMDVQRRTVKQ